jgi:hypothetical protein
VSKLVFAFSKATRSLRGQIVIQDPINNFGKINQLQGFHMHAFFTGSVAVGVYHTYDGSRASKLLFSEAWSLAVPRRWEGGIAPL